jgi:hypothetical protein
VYSDEHADLARADDEIALASRLSATSGTTNGCEEFRSRWEKFHRRGRRSHDVGEIHAPGRILATGRSRV